MDSKEKTNIFVDSDNIYDVDILIKLSENLPVEKFDLTLVSFDDTEFIIWRLNNVRDIVAHYIRIKSADLSKPILVRSDGVVIDGRHRIIKALAKGIKWLPSKKLTREQMKEYVKHII